MWSPDSRSQRVARLIAGAVAIVAAAAIPFTTTGAANPVTLAKHTADLSGSFIGASDRLLEFTVPADVLSQIASEGRPDLHGVFVYAEKADRTGYIAGTVLHRGGKHFVALRQDVADGFRGKADLLYAARVRNLDDALALLCAPEGPAAELARASQAILPVMREHLFGPLQERLKVEVGELIKDIPEQHSSDIDRLAEDLRKELQPEINELSTRLAEAAWDEIGVWGVAEGVGRKAADAGEAAWDWTKKTVGGLFGGDDVPVPGSKPRDFLSEERKTAISNAVFREAGLYWKANKAKLVEKGRVVVTRHQQGFLTRLENEWLPRLYDRVVKTTWEEHGAAVEEAARAFAMDFTMRRITAGDGTSPTLPVAYAVRSGTGVTDEPLLVLQLREPAGEPAPLAFLPYASAKRAVPAR